MHMSVTFSPSFPSLPRLEANTDDRASPDPQNCQITQVTKQCIEEVAYGFGQLHVQSDDAPVKDKFNPPMALNPTLKPANPLISELDQTYTFVPSVFSNRSTRVIPNLLEILRNVFFSSISKKIKDCAEKIEKLNSIAKATKDIILKGRECFIIENLLINDIRFLKQNRLGRTVLLMILGAGILIKFVAKKKIHKIFFATAFLVFMVMIFQFAKHYYQRTLLYTEMIAELETLRELRNEKT